MGGGGGQKCCGELRRGGQERDLPEKEQRQTLMFSATFPTAIQVTCQGRERRGEEEGGGEGGGRGVRLTRALGTS